MDFIRESEFVNHSNDTQKACPENVWSVGRSEEIVHCSAVQYVISCGSSSIQSFGGCCMALEQIDHDGP